MCQKCNKELLVEIGRNVDNCYHGSDWCSCKVRQFLDLIGIWELDDDGDEIRFATEWFTKATHQTKED